MIIEKIHGRYLVCSAILHEDFVLPGQVWAAADGSNREVKIESINGDQVYYTWEDDTGAKNHSRDLLSFQCRYCLVIDKE